MSSILIYHDSYPSNGIRFQDMMMKLILLVGFFLICNFSANLVLCNDPTVPHNKRGDSKSQKEFGTRLSPCENSEDECHLHDRPTHLYRCNQFRRPKDQGYYV